MGLFQFVFVGLGALIALGFYLWLYTKPGKKWLKNLNE